MLKKRTKLFRIFALLLTLLFVGSIFSGCSSPSPSSSGTTEPESDGQASKETYELSLAHMFPSSHIMAVEIIDGWIKAISEETGGRVNVTTYPSGTLMSSAEIYEGVVQGVVDIGISVYAYTRGRFPVLETMLLPGIGFNNSESASWAAMEAIEILDPEELHDIHHIWTWGTGPADLFIKRKPIRTLEDLKGIQLGTTAGPLANALEVLGATPVIMPVNDWYEALSRGMMDGGIATLESLQGFRLGEVSADYITLTPFLFNQLLFNVMNKNTWDSLPPDIQEGINRATNRFYPEYMPMLWNQINKNAIEFTRGIKNVEIITLSDEETARWKSFLPPLLDEYVETLNEKGLPGEEILQTVKELADKYNKQYPEIAPYTK